MSAEDATHATQQLLSNTKLPNAIFGLNDTIAFTAIEKIKITNNIALLGFTDEFHSTRLKPSLTSAPHPTLEIGREAAKLFFQLIEEGKNFKKQIILLPELVIRESSKK